MVVKQQLEGLFGPDYIEILPEAGPTSGFLSETRRAGKYAMQKCNWGPDYADPETYTDPFRLGGNYNFLEFCEGYEEADGTKTYNALVKAAKAITSSGEIEARYLAFADAEVFLLDRAIIIPMGYGGGGYVASKLNPFEGQYAPFGISNERYKGQRVLDEPMSTDQYFDAYDAWLDARAALEN
jgi:oligopeptide transport system substrate-binding protein